jgi:hypothetical protein
MNCGRRTHRDPFKSALGYIYMNLECTFKSFLVISLLDSNRRNPPLLITLGFEPDEPLIKKGKNK